MLPNVNGIFNFARRGAERVPVKFGAASQTHFSIAPN
jgi:hypothetical protein